MAPAEPLNDAKAEATVRAAGAGASQRRRQPGPAAFHADQQHAPLQQLFDAQLQLPGREGFAEVVVGPRLQALDAVLERG